MELKDGIQTFYAKNQQAWRNWLKKNHQKEKAVWLIIYKKSSHTPSIYYPEAVDEALCFGWIDSVPNKRDEESYYQFFARRNPKSKWSKVNRDKAARLIAAGKMEAAGFAAITTAQQNGTWTALDEVEAITVPEDLAALFHKNKTAQENFNAFSRSSKRGILEWILSARKADTRTKRIEETVRLAAQNIKANHPKPKK